MKVSDRAMLAVVAAVLVLGGVAFLIFGVCGRM
jgi:hypothetical protein